MTERISDFALASSLAINLFSFRSADFDSAVPLSTLLILDLVFFFLEADSAVNDEAISGVPDFASEVGVASTPEEDGVAEVPSAEDCSEEVGFGNITPPGPETDREKGFFPIRAENKVLTSVPLISWLHFRHFFAELTMRVLQDLQRINDNSVSS